MIKVIGVRFRQSGKVYYFDLFGQDVSGATALLLKPPKGVEFGEVTMEPTEVEDSAIVAPFG